MKVNKLMIPMKISFFLFCGSLGPYSGFLPTIARQLGYSLTTFGITMTIIPILSMTVSLLAGFTVDKFRIKKKLIFTTLILFPILMFLFNYIPKITSETSVELECDSDIILIVHSENNQQSTQNQSVFTDENIDQIITCKLDCQDTIMLYDDKMNKYNNYQYNMSGKWNNNTSSINNLIDLYEINVEFKLNNMKQNQSSYIFNLTSFQINGTLILQRTCQWHLKTFCRIICSNDAITDLAKVSKYRGNVLHLYQFWIFFIITCVINFNIVIFDTLQNSVCLDLLEDKPEDYGNQKIWSSIGWGGSSIFVGWLVDLVSVNLKEKDYSPVYYTLIVLSLCNLPVWTKVKVPESKKTKGKLKNVFRLFSKHYVIAFYLWSAIHRFFHTIITHFLFWYMEDLVFENDDPGQRAWLKTLQGLVQGVQCFGGEIPFFFCSGWIIKKLGQVNCMVLTLAVMAGRMYLYTVVWNPAWFILIELLNGVSFALGVTVKMSYAKRMAPPDTTNSIIGSLGFVDCIGDSVGGILGGYLFDSYGGVWAFRFFASGSALACILNLLSYHFGYMEELKNKNFTAVPTEINTMDDNIQETNKCVVK